jgi:hypothetical protein
MASRTFSGQKSGRHLVCFSIDLQVPDQVLIVVSTLNYPILGINYDVQRCPEKRCIGTLLSRNQTGKSPKHNHLQHFPDY